MSYPDSEKTYTAHSIPLRTSPPANDAMTAKRSTLAYADNFAASKTMGAELTSGFAEIEYDTKVQRNTDANNAVRFISTVAQPQTINTKQMDPIRRRFLDMRRLASNKPFARSDSELFYTQAKFMEDFTDDYQGDAKLNVYFPYYQHMGYEQLRTYFTWRTKMRNGNVEPTSVSYAFLYIYELLSNIGVKDPTEGLDKLAVMLEEFMMFAPALSRCLPDWIKDYHIYYELPRTFEDFAKDHNLYLYFPDMFLHRADVENRLELWCSISGYTVTGSKFYKDENKKLFIDCFDYVLNCIDDYYAKRGGRFEELSVYRISNKTPWDPFRRALFYPWYRQPDCVVKLAGMETYYCRNNRWTSCQPIFLSTRKTIAEYLIKKTEACLREATNYRHKLKVDSARYFPADKDLIILEGLIENAVAAFHRNQSRTVITVDHANLNRIREESLGTQSKLIVPEEDTQPAMRDSQNTIGDNSIKLVCAADSTPQNGALSTQNLHSQTAQSEWDALKEALDTIELQALSIALNGDTDIKAFADENGIMLEVLADGINEKAADIIGDSILESGEGLTIYDDYRENIAGMVMQSADCKCGIRNEE